MNIRYVVKALGCLLVLGALGACSDSDPVRPGEDPNILLTVEFDDYLLFGRPWGGFVFVSDQDGHVLDCAPWTSTSKVVLRNTEVHPASVSFTIFEYSDTHAAFNTEFEVSTGSVRRYPLRQHQTETGTAMVHLRNVPDTQRFIMSANYRTYLGGAQPPPSTLLGIVGDTTDLYAMVVPDTGTPVGGWLRGLRAGDRDTIDFESTIDVVALDAITLNIPAGADWGFCKASARVSNHLPNDLLSVDRYSWSGANLTSLPLYMPPLDPADIVLEFYQEFDGEIGTFYWQEIQGQLPNTLTNLEGDLVVNAASPDSVVIAANFAWDRFFTRWGQEKDLLASWRTEGPVSTEGWSLPEIPLEVVEVIPEFPRENFEMSIVEVYQETSEGVVRSQGKKFSTATKTGERELMRPGEHNFVDGLIWAEK